MKTYLSILNEFSPPLCRLIARRKRRGMTDREIADLAGWSIQKVVHIATQGSWEGITVGDMAVFMTACGVRPDNLRTHRRYLKRTMESACPLHHLRLPEGTTLRLLAALPQRT